MRRALFACLLWMLAGGAVVAEERDTGPRELGPEAFFVPPMDARGQPTHVVLRIVDDLTGQGIPGATGALHAQSEFPITGLAPADRTAVADEEGWLRIRADDLGWEPTWMGAYWTYVEAPGFGGVAVRDGRIQGEVRLSRARTVWLEVRDALDRPVPGATIGARSSRTCGHMPDQRVAVTDNDGRAVLAGLGPSGADEDAMGWECWVLVDTICADYHDVYVPHRVGAPQILRHGPSQPIEGAILEADGRPVVGADVGTQDGNHRGPWTRTGADGRFRLTGAPALAGMVALRERDAWADRVEFRAPPSGVSRIVRLPPPGERPPGPELAEVGLTLREAGTDIELDAAAVGLVAVRDGDGWTCAESWWGASTLLPVGAWTLFAGGGVSAFAPVRARLDVPASSVAGGAEAQPTVTLELVRHPPLRIAFEGDASTCSVILVSATHERHVTREELTAGVLSVPTDATCAFRLEAGDTGEVAFVPVPAGTRAADAPPLVLRAPRLLTVTATLEGPDGATVAGWLSADTESLLYAEDLGDWEPGETATPAPSTATRHEASIDLLAIPERRDLLPRLVRVTVPPGARGRDVFDAGRVALEPRGDRRLLVRDRAGKPLQPYGLRVIRGGMVQRGLPYEDEEDVDGIDPRLFPLQAGDLVEVRAPWEGEGPDALVMFAPTVRKRLEGPGPWTVGPEYPRILLALEATDEDGRPLDATLLLDGVPHELPVVLNDDGKPLPRELTGMTAGAHRILVAAESRLTQEFSVVLREGGRHLVQARLRPVPLPQPGAK